MRAADDVSSWRGVRLVARWFGRPSIAASKTNCISADCRKCNPSA